MIILPRESQCLILRPFQAFDIERVHHLLNQVDIRDTLLDIPEPFTLTAAEQSIEAWQKGIETRQLFALAIVRKDDEMLLGYIDLETDSRNQRADMAYWIDRAAWGNGYVTEAACEMVRFGFDELALNRIAAGCLSRNQASKRVLQKAKLQYEGTLRQHVFRDGRFEDWDHYGLLRSDYKSL